MTSNPVKRSKYIVALSKDHHLGLLFCWKIKEGLKRNVERYRITKYINFFWEHHLKAHFQEEEALLFNQVDDALCSQAKAEHQMIVERVHEFNYYENDYMEEYGAFAELLIKHIRFEERVLFPHLEAVLPLPVLVSVGDILNRQHSTPFKDDYPDQFWIHNKTD